MADRVYAFGAQGAAIGNCGIGPGDTVFLVDPSQPASNKRGAKDAGGQPNRMSFDMDGPADRGLQEHGKAQREENPVRCGCCVAVHLPASPTAASS